MYGWLEVVTESKGKVLCQHPVGLASTVVGQAAVFVVLDVVIFGIFVAGVEEELGREVFVDGEVEGVLHFYTGELEV